MTDSQEPRREGAPLGHSSAVQLHRDERRKSVAAMTAAHVPEREQARLLGCSQAAIQRDKKAIRRLWQIRSTRDYGALVAEEVGKLDEMERAFMPLARQGDEKAGQVLLRVMARRASLLGLDKPTRTEAKVTVEHTTELDVEIEKLLELMPHGDVPAG